MPGFTLAAAGQISDAYEVGPGSRVTTTGSGYVEWTSGTLADVRNAVATWQRWPGGSSSDACDTLRRLVLRGVASSAGFAVSWDESRRDEGPEGVYWQEQEAGGLVVSPAEFGAVGDGTFDDTAAILAAVTAAATANGGIVELTPGKTYLVRGDSLTWNAHNVVVQGAGIGQSLGSSAKPATIKFSSGGVYGVKVGAATNYSANLKYGNAFLGVKFDFNGQAFTDAAIVLEGLSRFKMDDSMGYNTASGSKMMRLKCVWDSVFSNNFFHTIRNAGSPLFHLDNYQTDASGNNNNLRWLYNHIENVDGCVFYADTTSNLNMCQWLFNKIEAGTVPTGSGTANFLFDLNNSSSIDISYNTFNAFNLTTTYAGLVRVGASGNAYSVKINDNNLSQITGGAWLTFGATARGCEARGNRSYNTATQPKVRNLATYQNHYERLAGWNDRVGANPLSEQIVGPGWTAASSMQVATAASLIPDIASVSTALSSELTGQNTIQLGAVVRNTTTAQGTSLFQLPTAKLRDFPVAVTMYVRCRRTADGATAALQVNLNGGTVITPAAGFDALPSAVTTISFDGDGTTVTATKATHGFKVGDRLIVTGTTSYNTTAGQPVQVLTVPDANTFTYASTVNATAESGSAQLCPWQVLSFTLPSGTFTGVTPPDTNASLAGLGRDSGDVFRLEYGASNNQAIDIDAVAFKY